MAFIRSRRNGLKIHLASGTRGLLRYFNTGPDNETLLENSKHQSTRTDDAPLSMDSPEESRKVDELEEQLAQAQAKLAELEKEDPKPRATKRAAKKSTKTATKAATKAAKKDDAPSLTDLA